MIPLAGQTLNAGHLTQPTASATGQSVMIILQSRFEDGPYRAVNRIVLPAQASGSCFIRPGPQSRYGTADLVPASRSCPPSCPADPAAGLSPATERCVDSRLTQDNQTPTNHMLRVLFVCTGNVFRSLTAEYALRRALGATSDVVVASAGTEEFPHVVRPIVEDYLLARANVEHVLALVPSSTAPRSVEGGARREPRLLDPRLRGEDGALNRRSESFDGLLQSADPGVGLTQQLVKNLILFRGVLVGGRVCAPVLALAPIYWTRPPVGSLEWLRPNHSEPSSLSEACSVRARSLVCLGAAILAQVPTRMHLSPNCVTGKPAAGGGSLHRTAPPGFLRLAYPSRANSAAALPAAGVGEALG